MKRRSSTTVLILGVASLLAAGGTLTAWANWTTGATAASVTAKADRIPTMGAPKAKLSAGKPRIAWKAVTTFPIDGYVVTRLAGATDTVVCTVPEATTSCVDAALPVGGTASYVVRATLGPRWTGPNSKASDPVTVEAAAADAKSDAVTPPTATKVAKPEPAPPRPAPADPEPKAEKKPVEKKDEEKKAPEPPATSSTSPVTTTPESPVATESSPDPGTGISG